MFESGETGQLVDQLRITGRSLVSGAGEGGISLQRLRNLAITMGDIAIAGLQLGAALSQLLVGKSMLMMSPFLIRAIGPLFAASGAMCPIARPEEPPE